MVSMVALIGVGLWVAFPNNTEDSNVAQQARDATTEADTSQDPVVSAALNYFAFADTATRDPQSGWGEDGTLTGVSDVATETEAWLLEGYVDAYRARNTKLMGDWQTEVVKSKPKGTDFYVDVCRDPSDAWTMDADSQEPIPTTDVRRLIRLVVTSTPDGWRVSKFIELTGRDC